MKMNQKGICVHNFKVIKFMVTHSKQSTLPILKPTAGYIFEAVKYIPPHGYTNDLFKYYFLL
jgi:hypothetical protein